MFGSTLKFLDLGRQTYEEVRSLQDGYVESRLRGEVGDSILFVEHPSTLALGRRTEEADLGMSIEAWKQRGVTVVRADRGGSATYHGPGQLVIYPVVHLVERRVGVREFVARMLDALARTVRECGVPAEADVCDAGVWVPSPFGRRKLASVGLRIVHGVTNHGFALNIDCELDHFQLFRPCGFPGQVMTSLSAERARLSIGETGAQLDRHWVIERLRTAIMEKLSETTQHAGAGDVGS